MSGSGREQLAPDPAAGAEARRASRQRLGELVALFLKLGTISFGGPAGHVALMEQEAVDRRKWLSREHFLDLVAATNLVPGPNATEMAIHLGYLRAGWAGLITAGAAFIVPSFAITLALSWAYVRYGSLPQTGAMLYGIKPAVVAVIAMAVWRLARSALRDWASGLLGVAVLAASALGADDVMLLVAAGLLMVLWRERGRRLAVGVCGLVWPLPALPAVLAQAGSGRLGQVFLYFLKVGSVLYGSGLVLYAFIQRDVVGWGWITQQQLVDAIAAGQITPGPVLSSATFIGYLIGGAGGAALATLGVFLPSFVIVALTGPWIPRLRRWGAGQAFLRGATVAAVALILKTGLLLGRSALVDPWTVAIAIVGVALIGHRRLDPAWIIGGGAAAGLVRLLLAG